MAVEPFSDTSVEPAVRGFLHRPATASRGNLVLTHGAGGNAQSGVLIAMVDAFSGAGFTVLRCDLPFRQARRFGPPRPGDAERDREGLKNAVAVIQRRVSGQLFLGGQSYGGRQASMLLADEPIAEGLLLLSYPLHAPSRPDQLRTQHFPELHTPTLFVHGTRDPFGSIDQIEASRKLIPAKTELLMVEGAGHDLGFKGKSRNENLPQSVLSRFESFFV